MQKLTAVQVEKAKPREKPYKLSDGGGFYLFCHTNGGGDIGAMTTGSPGSA